MHCGYPWGRAKELLLALRAALPVSVELWVGGGAVIRYADQVPGVRFFGHINQVPKAVADWRMRAALDTG